MIFKIIVLIAALLDNAKYFILPKFKSITEKGKKQMRRFLLISILTRVTIGTYAILSKDIVFMSVYLIGIIALAYCYFKGRKNGK